MASRIEEKMEANPTLDFDTALTETHREFGVFGFSAMEDGLKKSLQRQYSTTVFILIPTFILQLWVHLSRFLERDHIGGIVYALAVLLLVFAHRATTRVQRQALARCSELRTIYGAF